MDSSVKVFAPASISNLGCGFDVLGMALEKPGDEIVARFSDKRGLRITAIHGTQTELPTDPKNNTAGLAALRVLESLGETDRGIDFEIHKKMPIGSGLGSSAASAVAGAMAVNELLQCPLAKHDLLPYILEGEQLASGSPHGDNIAPSLLGGVVLVRSVDPMDVLRLPSPPGLYVIALFPKVEILTKSARDILRKEVPLGKMVQQSANLGALVTGFHRGDLNLIGRSMVDVVIEPQRAHLIPHFRDVQEAALGEGALSCGISGAGPTIFALCADKSVAEKAADSMVRIFSDVGMAYELFLSGVNEKGAYKF